MENANQHKQPLVLLPYQPGTDKYTFITGKIPRVLHPTVIYFLNMPLVGLTVDILRLIWMILTFVVSALSGKIVTRQGKVKRVPAAPTKLETQTHTGDPVQEKQLKEQFLVMASHELKTPMTTILGQVQLLLRRLSKMPELSAELQAMRIALESIDGQTRRLNLLVNDLLDLYNVHAGKVQLRLTLCNLVELCREVVEEQRFLTGHAIELKVPPAPVMLQADRDRLYQVVVNLVSNATRYSPEGSPVKVLVDCRRDIGIIEVYDKGPGIPRDEQRHIFEPFYRGSNVQESSKSGLGVGLAICKDIVERHSGRIWYRSREGKGSVFIVELPLNGETMRKRR